MHYTHPSSFGKISCKSIRVANQVCKWDVFHPNIIALNLVSTERKTKDICVCGGGGLVKKIVNKQFPFLDPLNGKKSPIL
jgi:hypothetical protein